MRPRRSVLAVPGSSPKMLAKAQGLPADEVFCDLEDAVAPDAKAAARRNVVAALGDGDWAAGTRSVRVNDLSTAWTLRDLIEVVEGAGPHLDCVILPKVTGPAQVAWLDLTLSQLERSLGLPVGRIGIEPQVEDAAGLLAVDAIAAGPRVQAVVFGPADFMASVAMRTLVVGEQPPGYEPGDAFHYPLLRILLAARAAGVQAVDGPYLQIRDADGFRRQARRTAALGYDGKWVLHPGQIDAANEVFSPDQGDYDHAELILDAYAHATTVRQVGAVMLGDEMIDEASRKMALVIAAKGRAAGLTRTTRFEPPD
jgi:citrate lyase subunit beta/citryl-CoA lyase